MSSPKFIRNGRLQADSFKLLPMEASTNYVLKNSNTITKYD